MHRMERSPSQRFRFEQYFDFLESKGINCVFSYIISEKDDKILYSRGHYFSKLKIFIKSVFHRLKDLREAHMYDFVFIQREAFMTGSTYFEKRLANLKPKLFFDFDDSIWLEDKSVQNKNLAFLKNPSKISSIIAMSDKVIAGNQYLADYAKSFNKNVVIIPTTIDTTHYLPKPKPLNNIITIGWSGSFSTVKHFEQCIPALLAIKLKFGDIVHFKLIGDKNYTHAKLGIKGIAWQEKTELEELGQFDIGIMPLPDNDWSRGKCGLKGLQYMGMAIPTIMSPVGVNSDIIADGVNGFLADTDQQWIDKLSALIESPELRHELGTKGRETVIKYYSVEANKQKYLDLFS